MALEKLQELLGEELWKQVAPKLEGKEYFFAEGKDFIPISKFNEVNDAKKEAEKQLQERDKQLESEIRKNQKEASEKLNDNKSKQAKEKMKSASDQIQQMSNSIKQQQQENESNQLGEDIEQVRQILKNLVKISKDQEDLMNNIKKKNVSDPLYQEIIKQQYHLKEKMQPISDTLFAISKRQPQIGYLINQELNKVEDFIEKSISTLLQYIRSCLNF
mgnify:CR=1 FL=1